jgi:hypothetical protein
LRLTIQRDIEMERRPPGVEWWAVPRLIFVQHRTMNRIADSDDLARVYRFDLAQDSEMISPTIPI